MKGFTFHKEERLCSQKIIGDLFTSGDSFLSYPLKVVFLKNESLQTHPAQSAFSVSKRNFKSAVKRNLLKRRMREAYRLNKPGFYQELEKKDIKLSLMFVYVGKEILTYEIVEKAMISALKRILAKL